MFVTSVDVESGMWDDHHPPSQKNQRSKKKQNTDWHDSSQIGFENGQFDDAHDDSSLALPYFDTDVQTTTTTSTTQAPSSLSDTTLGTSTIPLDWDRMEKLWKDCAVLEKLEQLVVGCLVGWKVCLSVTPPCFLFFSFFFLKKKNHMIFYNLKRLFF